MAKLVIAMVALTGTAHADTPSPWIDEQPSPLLTELPAYREEPTGDDRSWRVLAAAMLGMRGDQGGLINSGFRFVGIIGVITPPISVALCLDHQLGDDNRIPNTKADPARFSEWVGSARVGRAFPIGPDFWIQAAGGVARVNTRVTRLATMHEAERPSFGMDAVATIVWRSGYIASTLVFGVTAIPGDHELVVDGMRYQVPARVEPWFGLGVALMF